MAPTPHAADNVRPAKRAASPFVLACAVSLGVHAGVLTALACLSAANRPSRPAEFGRGDQRHLDPYGEQGSLILWPEPGIETPPLETIAQPRASAGSPAEVPVAVAPMPEAVQVPPPIQGSPVAALSQAAHESLPAEATTAQAPRPPLMPIEPLAVREAIVAVRRMGERLSSYVSLVRLSPGPDTDPPAASSTPSSGAHTLGIPAQAQPPASAAPQSQDVARASTGNAPAIGTVPSVTPRPLAGNAPPVYPAQARRLRQEGTVTLSIGVRDDGSVASVVVARSSGTASLDDAAIAAARGWRFVPATQNGKPSPCEVALPIVFTLRP